MKICFLTYGDVKDPKTWSGTTKRIYDFFSQEPRYELSNIDIKEVTQREKFLKYQKIFSKFLSIRGTTRDPYIYSKSVAQINNAMSNEDADIYFFIADHCRVNRKSGKKYFVYIDAIVPEMMIYERWCLLKKWFRKRYIINDVDSLSSFDEILTQNNWTQKSILENYRITNVSNVRFGINTSMYEGKKDYENHCMMIVLRRRTERVKGLLLLLKSFKIVKEQIPDAKLYVIGTELKKVDGVTYLPEANRNEIDQLYEKCSLYVMPAVREPNGITYLEALAHKTPIVGLNRFAIPEFTGNGEYGFIVKNDTPKELASTIIEALNDPKKLEQMGSAGQKMVKNRYCWDSVLSNIKSHIDE